MAFVPATGEEPSPTSLVLLTLDTTRADHVGVYGGSAKTPHLDALAAEGTRYARALTSSPLTLPAHTSLLTGLEPPAHGVQDNGTAVLPGGIATLAEELSRRGWATGAFVASRVLDRRFGLDRGFDVYDDRMTAERLGEYGYPERDAAAVTASASAWLASLPAGKPFFLWAHYYDPHAPYQPPPEWGSGYDGELAWVDHQVGRLLETAGKRPGRRLVAVVGDHGEMLGEHGERGHGIFLYRASLEVPLILHGPGVPAGRVVDEAVATHRLASTLLALLGQGSDLPGPPLPGLGLAKEDPEPRPVLHVTRMPASAYGWAPLEALSDQRFRLIVAPRPELYDFVADPGETTNLLTTERAEARRMKVAYDALKASLEERRPEPAEVDSELEAQLRSLGYLSGTSPAGGGTIDPKDGIRLLADFERAKVLLGRPDGASEALRILEGLVAENPKNVPFLTKLANAQLQAGRLSEGITTYKRAISLNPRLDFLHLQLAGTYHQLGRFEEAGKEYEVVLGLNPRAADAWLGLAEFAARRGDAAEERRILESAVAAGTASAAIRVRLGQIAGGAAAVEHYRVASELRPEWPLVWLSLGRALVSTKNLDEARRVLERTAATWPSTPEGQEARRLLSSL